MATYCNAFISFDIEGISGVSSWHEVTDTASTLPLYRKIATDEVNAAIRGIRAGDKKIGEILVCDSHARGENLIITDLEPGVRIIKGSPRRYYMISAEGRALLPRLKEEWTGIVSMMNKMLA